MRSDVFDYIDILDETIHLVYSDVKKIRHRTLSLPEPEFPTRLRFEIHLSGKSKQILDDEKELHQRFFDLVPDDLQEYFSFTYRIVEGGSNE